VAGSLGNLIGEPNMRHLILVMWMLCCSALPASAQVSVSIGINVPLYPNLVRVPGYPVYYAPQVDSNFFFPDGMYWVYQDDNWYASDWYDGPWGLIGPEMAVLGRSVSAASRAAADAAQSELSLPAARPRSAPAPGGAADARTTGAPSNTTGGRRIARRDPQAATVEAPSPTRRPSPCCATRAAGT
jgi:hypothetical protein